MAEPGPLLCDSSRLMRRILVDFARARGYQKRGGGAHKVTFDEALVVSAPGQDDLVALDDALEALAVVDQRKSQVVEMRFFGGLSVEETAEPPCVRRTVIATGRWPGLVAAGTQEEQAGMSDASRLTVATGLRDRADASRAARRACCVPGTKPAPATRRCAAKSSRCWRMGASASGFPDRAAADIAAKLMTEHAVGRAADWVLPRLVAAGRGRDGRGVSGARYQARARGRDQSAPAEVHSRSRVAWRGSSAKPGCSRR